MESRWKKKARSRWSSVLCVMRLPRSLKIIVIIIIVIIVISTVLGIYHTAAELQRPGQRTWIAERHVTHLPLCVRVHRVTPGAGGELRVWISTEVVGQFDAAVDEVRVVGVLVLVWRLRRPVLTHVAADGGAHQTAVRAGRVLQFARCTATKVTMTTLGTA